MSEPNEVKFYEVGQRYRITFEGTVSDESSETQEYLHFDDEDLPWIFSPKTVIRAIPVSRFKVGRAYIDKNLVVWYRTKNPGFPWFRTQDDGFVDYYSESAPAQPLRELV